jgi:hypothetical protein
MDAVFGEGLVCIRDALLLASAFEFVCDTVWQFKHAAIWTATDDKTANNVKCWTIWAHFEYPCFIDYAPITRAFAVRLTLFECFLMQLSKYFATDC